MTDETFLTALLCRDLLGVAVVAALAAMLALSLRQNGEARHCESVSDAGKRAPIARSDSGISPAVAISSARERARMLMLPSTILP